MSTLMAASPSVLKIRAPPRGLSGTATRVTLAWFLSSDTPRMTTSSMLRVSSFTIVPGLSFRLERTSNTTPNFLANSTERDCITFALVLHVAGFFFHNCSWIVIQTGADFKYDSEFFGELDRARLHHLRAEAGELQHFVVGNLLEFARAGHDARVGRIDAVHVGVNLAKSGFQSRRQCDGGQVRPPAAERGDLAIGRLALKTGDDDHVAVVQILVNQPG